MTSKCYLVKEHIDNLLCYLQPYLKLANFHMVDYFSKDGFENYIPESIKSELQGMNKNEVISHIFNSNYEDFPSLHTFVKKSQQFTLKNCPNVCFTTNTFLEKLSELGCEEFLRLKLNIFMTSKKSHEVEILSCVSAALRNISKTSHLIDIGDGKGYLSSMLALHHKVPVLGIDVSEINTNSAVKRVKKLSKVWNSVVDKSKEKNKNTTADLYKQITMYVDENINLSQLVSDIFLEVPNNLGIVGLHTCGNLADTSLRIFSNHKEIKTICNVGCCYHFLSEHHQNKKENSPHIQGFPMSDYLNGKKCVIGKAARMLAAQSVERILERKELPNETIFYRALFEIILNEKCPDLPKDMRQVGRFRKKSVNFLDYTMKAMERLKLNFDISDNEVNALYDLYKKRIDELNMFYLMRSMLAPMIENLILLDRLLFLCERGHENAFLVQLFDPVVSPRCYALIAFK